MSARQSDEINIKVCGIRDPETLRLISAQPVDYAGFIFAPSRRRVEASDVANWIKQTTDSKPADKRPGMVGVFRNQSKQEITDVLDVCPLDVVQLHGEEPPELCDWLKERYEVQVFKVFSVTARMESQELIRAFAGYAGKIDMLMLDTYDAKVGGGSGEAFNWQVIPEVKAWCAEHHLPLMIAGGLDDQNVEGLIAGYQPQGIDVSSGVETNGRKDHDKILSFIERVKPR